MVIELPSEVVGFHGTNHAAVAHLVVGDIRQSDQHFEWLGTGFYLWAGLALASSGLGRRSLR